MRVLVIALLFASPLFAQQPTDAQHKALNDVWPAFITAARAVQTAEGAEGEVTSRTHESNLQMTDALDRFKSLKMRRLDLDTSVEQYNVDRKAHNDAFDKFDKHCKTCVEDYNKEGDLIDVRGVELRRKEVFLETDRVALNEEMNRLATDYRKLKSEQDVAKKNLSDKINAADVASKVFTPATAAFAPCVNSVPLIGTSVRADDSAIRKTCGDFPEDMESIRAWVKVAVANK